MRLSRIVVLSAALVPDLWSAAVEPLAQVDALVTRFARQHHVPAISVAILREGRLVFAQGYGVADRERKIAASAATVYQTGSIAKQFTAAGVLRLSEQRKLSLDDPLAKWRPDFAHHGDGIRLRHLLQQTSGLREYFSIPAVTAAMPDITRPRSELIGHIRRAAPVFRPGERWSYSNSNYTLLALVIERIAGVPYDEFLSREFFQPLGLESVRHATPLPQAEREARGYVYQSGTLEPAAPENFEWARGDGGMCSNVLDLARWAHALQQGRVVSAESYRRMTTADALMDGTVPDYAYAVSLVPLDGEPRVSHGGAMVGFSNTLAHYPGRDLTIAVMTNLGGIWPQVIEQEIARTLLGLPAPTWQTVPLNAAEQARFVGRFSLGDMFATIHRGVHGLRVQLPLGSEYPLLYQGKGVFVAEPYPDAIAVRFDTRTATPQRLELLFGGMKWYGRRVEPTTP